LVTEGSVWPISNWEALKGRWYMVAGKRSSPLDLQAAKDALDRMLEGNRTGEYTPKTQMTKTAQLQQLRPQVRKLLADGFTWDEIVAALGVAGGVSKDTLRKAVRGKPPSKKTPKKKAALAAAPVHHASEPPEKKTAAPAVKDPADYKHRL
jgi:hypothetical protein